MNGDTTTGQPSPAIKLLPGERIINVERIDSPPLVRTPSGLRELYRLAQAKLKNETYELGPPIASLAFEPSSSAELHRYETLFARDALRVAMDLISHFPQLARTTLLTLASFQGTTINPRREEEPGRIPHEMRAADDPIARRLSSGLGWEWPYYGSVDATPEFIRTLITYRNRTSKHEDFLQQEYTNKDGVTRTMQDALKGAVEWLLWRTGNNPENLLESKTTLPRGIENQFWKDSWDAYFHKDGTMASHSLGVSSIEVQRLAYDALLDAAPIYKHEFQDHEKAKEIQHRATQIRSSIFSQLWNSAKGGYFVLGTDRDEHGSLRQLEVRTSNMGHLLHSRLLVGNDPQVTTYREAVVRQLFSAEMLTPCGIRTLASDEVRFRPGAYHNGSVWLWDTYLITKGLRRHGYHHLATLLSDQLLAVVDTTHAFPEFVRGDSIKEPLLNTYIVDIWDSTYQRANRLEQPPQQVQAWSVAAILALKYYKQQTIRLPQAQPSLFEQTVMESIAI